MNFRKKRIWGAALQRGYGCSDPKGDLLLPRVQEAFPQNFVEIG